MNRRTGPKIEQMKIQVVGYKMASVFQNIRSLEAPRPPTTTFQLAPTHVAYANTLRRLCMTAVEGVGFNADIREDGSTSDVQILANSTPMTNEMLAHRIGLLPIMVANPLDWNPDMYEFTLNVTNESNTTRDVTASDIKVFKKKESGDLEPVNTRDFFKPHPVTGETPLIAVLKPLLPGGSPEEIRFKAKATVGTGRQNARWIPTTQCAYSYTLDTDPGHLKSVFDSWLDRTKKINAANLEKEDPAKVTALQKEFNTLERNRCYLKNAMGEPESFDFIIESAGVLHPTYIVARACEAGIKMCEQFAGENLSQDVTVDPAKGRIRGWDFSFQRQDHTLGNCIQSWLDENLVGKGEITFAGYDVPHPLRDEMVIRIGCDDGQEATARRAIISAMNACAQMFRSWHDEWLRNVKPVVAPTSSTGVPTVKRTVRTITRPKATLKE